MKYLWKRLLMALAVPFMAVAMAASAQAKVVVNVDLSSQRMHVTVNGKHYATWRISSGRKGYYTPRGTWRPKWLKRMHYSRKYDNAPMPYSIFYHGGYAIHGTNAISRLGRPASHGCIRLHPKNAAELFRLVQRYGRKNTLIRVRGSTDVAYRNIGQGRRVAGNKRATQRRATARRAAAHRAAAKRRAAQNRVRVLEVYGATITR